MTKVDANKNNKSFTVTIKEYIDENYSDWRISMNVFTGLVGFSAVYINRVFKEVYGMNPIEYLQKVRLEKAKEHIELGTPLGMAAFKVGYNSMRTFYRVFEKETGMSPGKYKQRLIKTYEQFKDVVNMRNLRPLDYARKACDSMMLAHDPTRLPPVADLEGITRYSYMQGIFLLGMYKTYKLCGKKKYLNYIGEWIEAIRGEDGKIRKYKMHSTTLQLKILDAFQPMRIFMHMYEETGQEEYLRLTEYYMSMLSNWETVEGGILVHAPSSKSSMVCLNSVYMIGPSVCMYGRVKNKDIEYYDVATHQPPAIYDKLKNSDTGLLFHVWDEGNPWSDPETGVLYECWGRGIGYYIMGILDMLDYLPETHRDYERLCEIASDTLDAIAKYQDESGRWYQLVDKGDIKENWLENSCSCMFVYSFAKAINLGIIDKEYATAAMRGYSGIIDTIEYAENGEMILKDISEGIDVYDNYIDKISPHINDPHGVGAFVLMCTEIEKLLNNI